MWPNRQFPEDLNTFTGEILHEKLNFLCGETEYGELLQSTGTIDTAPILIILELVAQTPLVENDQDSDDNKIN